MEKQMNMNSQTAVKSASPAPLLQFVFAAFAVLTWVSAITPFRPDAAFVMGVMQISLGIAALIGSILSLQRGDPHANINLLLSVVLGFASGITQITNAWAYVQHVTIHPVSLSVILIMAGLYMLAMLPLMTKMPAYIFLEHLFVAAGFICTALAGLLSIPVLKLAGAWLLFLFALLALYQGLSDMYAIMGWSLPQGRSLF